MIQQIFQLGSPNLAVIPRQVSAAWHELLTDLNTLDELSRRLAEAKERPPIIAYWKEWAEGVRKNTSRLVGQIDGFMVEACREGLAVPHDLSTAWQALKARAS